MNCHPERSEGPAFLSARETAGPSPSAPLRVRMTTWICASPLRRPRPHPVLRPQMRHHQPYVFEADIGRQGVLNILQPLDALLQASRLNQRLRVGRNPRRAPISPAPSQSGWPRCRQQSKSAAPECGQSPRSWRPSFKRRSVCSAGVGSLAADGVARAPSPKLRRA